MSEQRLDVTTQEWRLVSPARRRAARETCELCEVVGDAAHPTVLVLDDPHTPLIAGAAAGTRTTSVHAITPAAGTAELVVHTAAHDEQLADMSDAQLALLVDVWAARYGELSAREGVAYVFVHADSGGVADRYEGHSHGGIHAYAQVPPRPAQELRVAAAHLVHTGRCVLCDVVAQERTDGLRVVAQNRHFVAYVPFAPRHAFEVHVAAHRHATSLLDLSQPERQSLGALLRSVARAYDGLSDRPAEWAMAMHQAPVDDGESLPIAHFHVEFVLVRSGGDVVPDLGSVALGAGVAVHALTPGEVAARLRAAATTRSQ